jgi:hypothetical protein
LKRANEWTRDKLAGWGLTNAHLEAWGPFGRGWSLKRFSAQVVEPQCFPLIGCPSAWSPGFDKPLVADVVYLDTRSNTNLDAYKGKLRGAIVLTSPARELRPHFEAMATRLVETNLLELANAAEPPRSGGLVRLGGGRSGNEASGGARGGAGPGVGSMTNRAGFRFANRAGRFGGGARNLSFLTKEGAALVVNCSFGGDGGTFSVSGASVPVPEGQSAGSGSFTNLPRAWSTNAPAIPPQVTLAAEDYNRVLRMIQQGEKVKMAVDLQVQFHNEDLMAYNTVAEIPGSDRKDEIVMLGAHMDSWHGGTGATDNGVGVATTMEAMRILKAIKVQPRRTIRLGLWSGEEQGLLGSKAYVAAHFGYYTNSAEPTSVRSPKDQASSPAEVKKPASTNAPPARRLVRFKEYEKLSTYFNLDNGAGRVRGIYLQGNESVRPLFRRWLEPFRDLDALTISLSNTTGTDHQSFDAIGLPGFQFIQDPLDYMNHTHHTNQDVLDRVPSEDAKQAAVILAAFAWDAAMADSKLPRKPLTP